MEVTIIKIVLAVIFTLSVAGKLTGKTKSTFENAGYGPIVMYATAIAEIILTVGLFTRFEMISAVGLLVIIGGAIGTLLRQKVNPSTRENQTLFPGRFKFHSTVGICSMKFRTDHSSICCGYQTITPDVCMFTNNSESMYSFIFRNRLK